MNPNESEPRAGLSGTLRMLAVLAVLAAAVFGMLAVFDVIPREQLVDYGIKTLAALAILALAGIAIGLLSRR